MRKGWSIAVGVVAAGLLVTLALARWQDAAAPNPKSAPDAAAGVPPRPAPNSTRHATPAASSPTDPHPPAFADRGAAARAIAAAESELAAATEAQREADFAIDDLEREVEAAERYVEDLRQRGEDPARYAEEGMEQVGPLIDRYEARLQAAEHADERVARARADLERARAALADFGG